MRMQLFGIINVRGKMVQLKTEQRESPVKATYGVEKISCWKRVAF